MRENIQEEVFLTSEGDAYYQRNIGKLKLLAEDASSDRTITCLQGLDLSPKSILEIGCGNGWRLEALREIYNAKCYGIDPSKVAVRQGKKSFPKISLRQGTAENLPYVDNSFELVIFGFCLYMCSREYLFKIAYEADRVLGDKGHIALLDFHPLSPYRNPYKHNAGVSIYKMDYSRLFTWNPAYAIIAISMYNESDGSRRIDQLNERVSVAVLQKNTDIAYPANPWSKDGD